MTTLSEWESELRALRLDLGPTRPLAIRWRPRHEAPLRYPLLTYLSRSARDEEQLTQWWDVAFYEPGSEPGARPIAMVRVAAETRFPLRSPLTVDVGGVMEPGHAVAFRLPNGDKVIGATPVVPAPWWRPMRWPPPDVG